MIKPIDKDAQIISDLNLENPIDKERSIQSLGGNE